VTAWGEAQRAKPQVNVRKENPLRPERTGQQLEKDAGVFVSAFQALGSFVPPVTWASTRHARCSPGCNIAGFQPDSDAERSLNATCLTGQLSLGVPDAPRSRRE